MTVLFGLVLVFVGWLLGYWCGQFSVRQYHEAELERLGRQIDAVEQITGGRWVEIDGDTYIRKAQYYDE
jgi:hypothetical protein